MVLWPIVTGQPTRVGRKSCVGAWANLELTRSPSIQSQGLFERPQEIFELCQEIFARKVISVPPGW